MSVGISGSIEGSAWSSSTSTSATYASAPISDSYDELTVTAGLSSLTAPEATKTGGAVAATGVVGSMITAAPVVAAAVAALL